jgi:hypothetical protein
MAYATATTPVTRTRAAVAAKDDARAALRKLVGWMSRIIQGVASVSDAQKIELGLNVRKSYTRVARPASAPNLWVDSLRGSAFRVQLREPASNGRGLPPGVAGANLYYCVAEHQDGASAWTFAEATSRADLTVHLPASIPPGSRVWFAARWFNPRQETGPFSRPVGAWVQFGGMPETVSLKAA